MHWYLPQWVKKIERERQTDTVGALLNLNNIYSKIGKKKNKLPRDRRRKKSLPLNIL